MSYNAYLREQLLEPNGQFVPPLIRYLPYSFEYSERISPHIAKRVIIVSYSSIATSICVAGCKHT